LKNLTDDITSWAESLTKEVYETWKRKYQFWKLGFKVFYGPVRANPKVMIVSYQPGGNERHFEEEDKYRFEQGDFSLHPENIYLATKHRMAMRMQSLFSRNEKELRDSVTFPLIFFRSPNIRTWHSMVNEETRVQMESYCFERVSQILQVIHPQVILVLGFRTYDLLTQIMGEFEVVEITKRKSERLYCKATKNNIRIIGIIHPTGSRIARNDWEKIRDGLRTEIPG